VKHVEASVEENITYSQICRADRPAISLGLFDIDTKFRTFGDISIEPRILYTTSSFCAKRITDVRNIWQLRNSLMPPLCTCLYGPFTLRQLAPLSPLAIMSPSSLPYPSQRCWKTKRVRYFTPHLQQPHTRFPLLAQSSRRAQR
jgi:hypothetical protein